MIPKIDHKLKNWIISLWLIVYLMGCTSTSTNPTTRIFRTDLPAGVDQITNSPEVTHPDIWVRENDGMRIVKIPGGEFKIGSTEGEIEDAIDLCREHYQICNRWYYEREDPIHSVKLDSYWMDQAEISNLQYRLCINDGYCLEPAPCVTGDPNISEIEKDNHPIVCVNWQEAQDYCQWVDGRLPTEAEWEYAYRGTDRVIYPWGNIFDGSKLNYCDLNCDQTYSDDRYDDGYSGTAPVGSYISGVTWSGIYNMSGNVTEWVSDWFGAYPSVSLTNPTGPSTGDEKVIKGCSWFFHPTYCRAAVRHSVDPDTRQNFLGFRCVIDSPVSYLYPTNPEKTKKNQISTQQNLTQPATPELLGTSSNSSKVLINTETPVPPVQFDENHEMKSTVRPMDDMKTVHVPSGSFIMGGSEDQFVDADVENPPHIVELDSYWIDKMEVTNAQYNKCVDAGACRKPRYANTTAYNGLEFPVVGVSWQDAADYCSWVDGKLPTEAEWEYAAKGLNGSIYPWGNEFDGKKLNYCDKNCSDRWADQSFDDGYIESAPVGSYPSGISWVGALDLAGNVWEWVWDWYAEYSPDRQINPTGPDHGIHKVIRGGAWGSPAEGTRTTYRIDGGGDILPTTRHPNIGFRCVVPDDRKLIVEDTKENLTIPIGDPPVIDGELDDDEWNAATVEKFANGSDLHLLQNDDSLYLGIQAATTGMIAGNVYIYQGEDITILHASAALGTAVYQVDGTSWQQVRNFSWCCRSASFSQSAQAERAAFSEDEGWIASNGHMGAPNELEYKIEIPKGQFQMAVVFVKASPPYEKVPWPADLQDDCIKPTPGGMPKELVFSPDDWVAINLTNIE